MNKSYFFKHDFNAHDDSRMVSLLMEHGLAGYGAFWYLIELLAQADDYKLEMNSPRLAYILRCDESLVSGVINSDLFEHEGGFFWSDSLIRRLEKLEATRQKRSEAGKKSAIVKQENNKCSTNVEQVLNKCSTSVQQNSTEKRREEKRREEEIREEKEKKEENTTRARVSDPDPLFCRWWDAYGKKVGKAKTEAAWKRLSLSEKQACIESVEKYIKATPDVQFRKNPMTYINGKHWEDEIVVPVGRIGDNGRWMGPVPDHHDYKTVRPPEFCPSGMKMGDWVEWYAEYSHAHNGILMGGYSDD